MCPRWFLPFLLLILWGCSGQSALKPDEVLDERTGITWAVLHQPIDFLQGAQSAVVVVGKRASLAYLGPVEWTRSGDISYSLWIHVVPGDDRRIGDIHADGAVTLMLDDGPMVVSPEARKPSGEPYRPLASWGQTAYFHLDVEGLKRIAASRNLTLEFRAADGSAVSFNSNRDTHAVLSEYLQSRNITGD
jgi:hypothetical protein